MARVTSGPPDPRCFMHGLTADQDGRCTLCRRAEPPPPSGEGRLLQRGLVILSVLVAVAIAYKGGRGYVTAFMAEREAEARAEDSDVPLDHVRLYTTPWCPHCNRAKQWLKAQHIEFDEVDLERTPTARLAHRKLSPRGSIPTLDADGEVVVGFDPDEYKTAIRRAKRKASRAPVTDPARRPQEARD